MALVAIFVLVGTLLYFAGQKDISASKKRKEKEEKEE